MVKFCSQLVLASKKNSSLKITLYEMVYNVFLSLVRSSLKLIRKSREPTLHLSNTTSTI